MYGCLGEREEVDEAAILNRLQDADTDASRRDDDLVLPSSREGLCTIRGLVIIPRARRVSPLPLPTPRAFPSQAMINVRQ